MRGDRDKAGAGRDSGTDSGRDPGMEPGVDSGMDTGPETGMDTGPETDEVLEDLRALVEIESPSSDLAAVRSAAEMHLGQLQRHAGGRGEVAEDGLLVWESSGTPSDGDGETAGASSTSSRGATVAGSPPVLLLGHLDTVWSHGTLARLPFAVRDGRVTGPGVFDMKAGLVVVAHALGRLREQGRLPAVRVLVTPDEEIGAPRSRERILAEAAACSRVLVCEPSGPDGALKVGRKGMARGRVVAHGRAAHSGLDPEQGINAAVVLGRVLADIEALSDPQRGTTVVPTLVRAGSAINTVPALAEADLDVRFCRPEEADRVRAGLQALPVPPGARIDVELEVNRGPLTPAASDALLPVLRAAEAAAGWQRALDTVEVGGASDGNLAAEAGAGVLDGLGPRGAGAHADHEHVVLADLVPRVRLLTELVARVAAMPVA